MLGMSLLNNSEFFLAWQLAQSINQYHTTQFENGGLTLLSPSVTIKEEMLDY